jgi:hypothetical protein
MSARTLLPLAAVFGFLGGCATDPQPSGYGVSLADLPSIQRHEYRVDPYIRAAGQLQSAGKETASQQLLTLARTAPNYLEERLKVAVLCRMLFSKRPGSDFARPDLGGPSFLDGYTGGRPIADSFDDPRFKKWPLEPIEIVDGVPFAIVTGYTYEGNWDPRGTESYVRYCMTNCDWSSTLFTRPSSGEKEAALRKLLSSSKWGGQLGAWEGGYLKRQID